MNAPQRLRFGLVGAGAIAQTYAQAFTRSETAQLVAVADVRREASEALAQQVGGTAFASHEEMAAALELDAVVICAPPIATTRRGFRGSNLRSKRRSLDGNRVIGSSEVKCHCRLPCGNDVCDLKSEI